ncbi:response regulator transcription factor [Flavobacterium supellecticarium]|uniref:Response regulator transcription factor n=1 Tax=Flavobacterium supellecticarium TaxID=2565924 RepID=A0A4S4A522_9FLAO|nr:response regulator transcription factor [Flavobacterium supellecticarium]THF53428.1 response regulator transcription factor [Flavobacterium supellecticarium]
MLRVGIVDDHKLFRKSLSFLINSFENTNVVLEAQNGLDLLDQIQDHTLDLLLLDIQMPGMDGFETCEHIRKHYPDMKVLIVSQLTTKESIHKVMELGAHGFFTKNSEPEQLENAIKSIQDKDFYFGQELGMVLREAILWEKNNKPKITASSITISDREMDVIRMACKELSSIEIADRLHINVRTVETHRKRIMEKTNSKNFIGVILFALRNQLISIDELTEF